MYSDGLGMRMGWAGGAKVDYAHSTCMCIQTALVCGWGWLVELKWTCSQHVYVYSDGLVMRMGWAGGAKVDMLTARVCVFRWPWYADGVGWWS